jgi:hypothetical protein
MAVHRNQTCTQERKQFCRDCRRRESDTPVACLILITRIPCHFITYVQGPTVPQTVGCETDQRQTVSDPQTGFERTYVLRLHLENFLMAAVGARAGTANPWDALDDGSSGGRGRGGRGSGGRGRGGRGKGRDVRKGQSQQGQGMISGSGSGDEPLETSLDSAWASLAVKSDECSLGVLTPPPRHEM